MEEGEIVYPQNDLDEVVSIIEEIKQSNINGGAINYYLRFNKEIYAFAENVELGNKTYDYIMIDAPLLNHEEGKKELVSDRYNLGNVTTKNIPHSNVEYEVIPIKFDKYNYLNDTYEDAYFHVYVTAEDVDSLIHYISSVTGQQFDETILVNTASSVAASIPGVNSECNRGVRKLVLQLTGDSILYPQSMGGKVQNPGKANDIAIFLDENNSGINTPKKFHEVTFEQTISLSQSGFLIVSVWNSGNPNMSGHINVLLPGVTTNQYNWYLNGTSYPNYFRGNVPFVFDTGGGNRWPDSDIDEQTQRLTMTYASQKHQNVKFYMYLNN
ncbi:hypothetical protein L21SP5_00080 [Salinivirga cyanobacteriivorans]|uniref:Uncharacterized protein n=1 Tax=Salinivirga cyanobacteriivorans TaxID=1307839 RepID=A0A0S2HUN2_9BACT|nr:hypothetical protein [Salinivirga cyanobacteriivorans]ALO13762.1 hypothetical protein L21SP5_00080 [Salinivirga cyanobacteriivorans]